MATPMDQIVKEETEGPLRKASKTTSAIREDESRGPISRRVIKTIGDITEARMYKEAFPGIPLEQLVGRTIELSGSQHPQQQQPQRNLTVDLYDMIELEKAVYMLKTLKSGGLGGAGDGGTSPQSLTREDIIRLMRDESDARRKEELTEKLMDRIERLERGDVGSAINKPSSITQADVDRMVNERMIAERLKQLEEEKRTLQMQVSSTPKESPELKFYTTMLEKTTAQLDSLSRDAFVRKISDTMDERYTPLLRAIDDKLKAVPADQRKGILEQAFEGTEQQIAEELGKSIISKLKGTDQLITQGADGRPALDMNATVTKVLGIIETAITKLPAVGSQPPAFKPPAQFKVEEVLPPPPPPTTTPSTQGQSLMTEQEKVEASVNAEPTSQVPETPAFTTPPARSEYINEQASNINGAKSPVTAITTPGGSASTSRNKKDSGRSEENI